MAPPAAPTAAPTTAPTAASFTTSAVLSRSPVCEAAYRLQASTAACGGIVDGWATPGAGALALPVLTAALLSSPTPLATTRPVTSAAAIIKAIPISLTLHGSQLPFLTFLLPGR